MPYVKKVRVRKNVRVIKMNALQKTEALLLRFVNVKNKQYIKNVRLSKNVSLEKINAL